MLHYTKKCACVITSWSHAVCYRGSSFLWRELQHIRWMKRREPSTRMTINSCWFQTKCNPCTMLVHFQNRMPLLDDCKTQWKCHLVSFRGCCRENLHFELKWKWIVLKMLPSEQVSSLIKQGLFCPSNQPQPINTPFFKTSFWCTFSTLNER